MNRTTAGRRPNRHQRRSQAEREELVAEYRQSGKSPGDYCHAKGICVGTFYNWLKLHPPRPVFREVELPLREVAAIEVVWPNGVRARLPIQGGREEVVALVRGLAGC